MEWICVCHYQAEKEADNKQHTWSIDIIFDLTCIHAEASIQSDWFL